MTTMLCVRAATTTYCLPISATRAVRSAVGITALPAPKESVIGVLPDDPPLAVIGPFGTRGSHVVVVDCDGARFGLLVDEVIGLRNVDDTALAAAPAGQAQQVIAGSLRIADEVAFLIDAQVLAGAL
ncbi:MAG TPA: chemotaxis protein CheW [Jatrophihabitans sp.]|jgi:chemotaxis signal transduction protein|nr:chemotaxis protein CheW [Jatrophihabitans sp.]